MDKKQGDPMADMETFENTFPDLVATRAEKNRHRHVVGMRARFDIPSNTDERREFIRRHGMLALGEFEIIGIQKDWRGMIAYRCRSLNGGASRCVDPMLLIKYRKES